MWAVALAWLVLAPHPAMAAAHAHPKPEQPPSVALSEIRTYDGRPAPFALDARAAMLVAADSGTVLYAWREHERVQPASLAKIMTFLITLDALSEGKLKPDALVTVSEQAWRLSMDQTVSRMFLEPGQQVSVRDLLYGLMVSSGNDAALALAEYIGGSREAFVAMMNEQCAKLGLEQTRFSSPDGLPEPDQYTTAADMVKLAQVIVARHPQALAYTSTKEFTFHKITQRNWNTLLFYDSRVNGLKTGHVAEAGFHLVATADSHGLKLISALMGAPNAEKRRTETEKLLDWAFRSFVAVTPDWRHAVPADLPVYQGVARSVSIAPARVPTLTVARGEENRIKAAGRLDSRYLVAPLKKGQRVGELAFSNGDKVLATIPLETQSAVARGGLFRVMADRVRMIFSRR